MEIILRPFVLLLFLAVAWGISRLVHRFIPPGRVKDALYKPRKLIPEPPEQSRR